MISLSITLRNVVSFFHFQYGFRPCRLTFDSLQLIELPGGMSAAAQTVASHISKAFDRVYEAGRPLLNS